MDTNGLDEKINQWGAWALDKLQTDLDIRWEWNGRIYTTAGRAFYRQSKIELSREFFSVAPENECRQTVLHEIAHITSYKWSGTAGHGWAWRNDMMRLGLEPKRCHRVKVRDRSSEVYCKCGPIKVGPVIYKKIVNGQKRYCRNCGADVVLIQSNLS